MTDVDVVEYEFIGRAPWIVDTKAGSRQIWERQGEVKPIKAVFAPLFEKLYVDCEDPQMRRVTPKGPAAKAGADDIGAIPTGSQYSGMSAVQLKRVYTEKTGKLPVRGIKAVDMIAAIQNADLDAELAGVPLDDF